MQKLKQLLPPQGGFEFLEFIVRMTLIVVLYVGLLAIMVETRITASNADGLIQLIALVGIFFVFFYKSKELSSDLVTRIRKPFLSKKNDG